MATFSVQFVTTLYRYLSKGTRRSAITKLGSIAIYHTSSYLSSHLCSMAHNPKQHPRSTDTVQPWLFRSHEKVNTRLQILDEDQGSSYYTLSREAAWPFIYLDTAYWHALAVSRSDSATARSQAQVEYLDHLRAVVREELRSLPAELISKEGWTQLQIQSPHRTECPMGDHPSEIYLLPFQNLDMTRRRQQQHTG